MSRIPSSLDLGELQQSFRELWEAADRIPGFDLGGDAFDNAGDAVSDRALITKAEMERAFADLKQDRLIALANREITGGSFGDLLDFQFALDLTRITVNASTVFVDIPNLSFSVGAGDVWVWICVVGGRTSAIANMKFTFKAAGAPSVNALLFGVTQQTLGTFGTAFGAAVSSTIATTLFGGYLLGGYIDAASDGIIQLQGAQNTSDPTDTVFAEGSGLIALRVG